VIAARPEPDLDECATDVACAGGRALTVVGKHGGAQAAAMQQSGLLAGARRLLSTHMRQLGRDCWKSINAAISLDRGLLSRL
jgi:hypothetical protein